MNDYKPDNQRYTQNDPRTAPQRGWGHLQSETAAEVTLSERLGFIRKVYALFFVGILFAVGGVLFSFMYPPLLHAVWNHYLIAFLLMIGGVMGAQAVRHVPGVNLAAFFGFTALTGIVIS